MLERVDGLDMLKEMERRKMEQINWVRGPCYRRVCEMKWGGSSRKGEAEDISSTILLESLW